jgi:hypothetical protein
VRENRKNLGLSSQAPCQLCPCWTETINWTLQQDGHQDLYTITITVIYPPGGSALTAFTQGSIADSPNIEPCSMLRFKGGLNSMPKHLGVISSSKKINNYTPVEYIFIYIYE